MKRRTFLSTLAALVPCSMLPWKKQSVEIQGAQIHGVRSYVQLDGDWVDVEDVENLVVREYARAYVEQIEHELFCGGGE